MKKVIKYKQIEYAEYVAEDGTVFNNEDACILYERKLKQEVVECPDCNGLGKVKRELEDCDYHTGVPMTTTIYPTCEKCNGRGYLVKKTIYV